MKLLPVLRARQKIWVEQIYFGHCEAAQAAAAIQGSMVRA